jgi:uncharacterized membrane protein AbrB (regulator of aidB expression)
MTFLFFILVIIAGQVMNRRALNRLTPEEKVRAVDFGSGRGVWSLVALAVVYSVQLVVTHYIGYPAWLLPVFCVFLLIVIGTSLVFDFWRLRRFGLPDTYVRTVGFTYLLLFAGLFVMFGKDIYVWTMRGLRG